MSIEIRHQPILSNRAMSVRKSVPKSSQYSSPKRSVANILLWWTNSVLRHNQKQSTQTAFDCINCLQLVCHAKELKKQMEEMKHPCTKYVQLNKCRNIRNRINRHEARNIRRRNTAPEAITKWWVYFVIGWVVKCVLFINWLFWKNSMCFFYARAEKKKIYLRRWKVLKPEFHYVCKAQIW